MKISRNVFGLGVCAFALLILSVQALGFDLTVLLGDHAQLLAGLGLFGMAGEIKSIDDLKPALREFTESATKKIDSTLQRVKALEDQQSKDQQTIMELRAEASDLAMKGAKRVGHGGAAPENGAEFLAKSIADDEGFKLVKAGRSRGAQLTLPVPGLNIKGGSLFHATSNASTSERQPGFVSLPGRRLSLRDMLPVLSTDAGQIEYIRSRSLNAAKVVPEGNLKPGSEFDFERVKAEVVTIAHWAHCSKQLLDDTPALVLFLENQMIRQIRDIEDRQILEGSGKDGEFLGLYKAAYALDPLTPIKNPNQLDVIRMAIGQLERMNFDATTIVLNSDDWTLIELMKNKNEDYLSANPSDRNAQKLWGRPVISTATMEIGNFLVGDMRSAAILYDRQEPTLDIATQDGNDFIYNMIKLRAEMRISLALQLPEALVKGKFNIDYAA